MKIKITMKDCSEFIKKRDKEANKGDFGTIGILGGCTNYSGAIKLANLSAASIRAGSGVTRLIVPKETVASITPYLLEATIFKIEDKNGNMIFNEKQIAEALKKVNALAVGMGWGNSLENEKILIYILKNYPIPVVIDADGINALSKMDLELLKNKKSKVILTPHPKEFERLSKISIDRIKNDPLNISKDFAKKYNVILLLKGHRTIVTDGINSYIVEKGGPGMATAGSGDVLSGVIVGMLGSNNFSAKLVAVCAYITGFAGEIAQEKYTDISMKASDTIESIPEAIKRIRKYNDIN